MEEMTSKQISALIAWLEAKGMTPEEILDCLRLMNKGQRPLRKPLPNITGKPGVLGPVAFLL
ncbi:MAG: hypothetical protein ACLT0Y_02270 [Christensenellales bacterium]